MLRLSTNHAVAVDSQLIPYVFLSWLAIDNLQLLICKLRTDRQQKQGTYSCNLVSKEHQVLKFSELGGVTVHQSPELVIAEDCVVAAKNDLLDTG
jgi:hypothetical protein